MGLSGWAIRAAGADELDALAAIEIDAYATYALAVGKNPADAHATPRPLVERALREKALFIAEADGCPIGFVACHIIGDLLHVIELDVRRDWQRRGVGRSLMRRALQEIAPRGLRGAMLTTDRFAPFNAPFYASLGFHEASADQVPQSLNEVLFDEIARGHDPIRRVAMLYNSV